MEMPLEWPADATETALIVPISAAERVVGRHRRTLDHSALWGVPAHVTVLYPFGPPPPGDIVAGTITRVGAALSEVNAFQCTFARVRWFGDDVVWLGPEPEAPFRELTGAVWRRFPDHPPYRGMHEASIPHLTIGSRQAADLASMRRAADDVRTALPFTAWVDRVVLIAGAERPDSWRTLAEFPLSN